MKNTAFFFFFILITLPVYGHFYSSDFESYTVGNLIEDEAPAWWHSDYPADATVEVDPADAAFDSPSKPIGSFMDEPMATARQDEDGWDVVEDAGRGWRRVVASPLPIRIENMPQWWAFPPDCLLPLVLIV